jgi:hypothetical protein
VTVDRRAPKRYPWWQLILLGLVAMVEALFRPLGRMWRSDDPLDTYGLAHLGSVAGDAMVAIALAGSVFFEIPVGKAGPKVAAFLALTIAPLAVAGLFLVPLLDRAGPRRAISFGAAIGRAVVSARRPGSARCCCPRAFLLLVLSGSTSRRTGSPSRTRDRTRARARERHASVASPTGGQCWRPAPRSRCSSSAAPRRSCMERRSRTASRRC